MVLGKNHTGAALPRRIGALRRVFATQRDKREAHQKSREVMAEMAADPRFFTEAFKTFLLTPDALRLKNYPTVSFRIDINPHYELVANCWIPLPGRETDISTKAIHHHGDMLLTTATAFGPGYEHWLFTAPVVVDPEQELFALKVVEQGPHPLHHVAFVDADVPHLPLFPPSLTITLALWSHRRPTTWKDRAKRIGVLARHRAALRQLALKLKVARHLDLNVVDYFDYYPSEAGFKGMKDRKEFNRGPNCDYLHSLFHVIQETGNDGLAGVLRGRVEAGAADDNAEVARCLLSDLEAGRPIEGRLSEGHYGVPFANFTKRDIERALAAQGAAATPRPAEQGVGTPAAN